MRIGMMIRVLTNQPSIAKGTGDGRAAGQGAGAREGFPLKRKRKRSVKRTAPKPDIPRGAGKEEKVTESDLLMFDNVKIVMQNHPVLHFHIVPCFGYTSLCSMEARSFLFLPISGLLLTEQDNRTSHWCLN